MHTPQLYLAGNIVTIDAMGCQTDIAQKIIDKKADYALALKGNQGQLHQDVREWFEWAEESQFRGMAHRFAQTINKNHGRIEIRQCWALADPRAFEVIRLDNDLSSVETAFFISSLPPDAERLLAAIRAHWSIENNFHWTLVH